MMDTLFKKTLLGIVFSLYYLSASVGAEEEKVLNIYNWSDYIAEDTVANFEKKTGIKVNYDVFDSNEVLEAKLLAGNTGFDLVVPTINFLARQIQAGVFEPLNKSQLNNFKNLDKGVLARTAARDPGNAYAIPYLWGTNGIGYNEDKVLKALGKDAPVDSWELVFNPANLEKLKSCGVAFFDTPSEMIPMMLHYLGEDPNSFDKKIINGKAVEHFKKLRPFVTYFHSSQYINDLANGDICVAIGWSGDMLQARDRAIQAENGVNIKYVIPKEGTAMWIDMMAIPKGAKHPKNAHRFLNYLMRPKVIAAVTNYVQYANGNAASKPFVDAEILANPCVYPNASVLARLYTFAVFPPKVDRLFTRGWTKIKTGK